MKEPCWFAAVDDCHGASCIKKQTISRQQNIKWHLPTIYMTLVRAPDSEFSIGQKLPNLFCSANVLSGLAHRERKVSAVTKSLRQKSRTFDFRYGVSFQEARVANIVRDLDLWEALQAAVQSSYGRYVRAMKIKNRFLEALHNAEKQNNKAASEDFNATRNALSAAHLDSIVFPGANERSTLLQIEAAAAYTQDQ